MLDVFLSSKSCLSLVRTALCCFFAVFEVICLSRFSNEPLSCNVPCYVPCTPVCTSAKDVLPRPTPF
jgi:hypothetical protein